MLDRQIVLCCRLADPSYLGSKLVGYGYFRLSVAFHSKRLTKHILILRGDYAAKFDFALFMLGPRGKE